MDVSKYFNGWFKGFNNNWLGLKNIGALRDQVKNQFFFYTDYQDFITVLLHHSPELTLAMLDYANSY